MRPHLSESDIETLVASAGSADAGVLEHAASCAECRAALASAREDLQATARALSAWSPGFDAVKLARRVTETENARPSDAVTWSAAAASLVLFVGLAFVRNGLPSLDDVRGVLVALAKAALFAHASLSPAMWLAVSVIALASLGLMFVVTERYAVSVRRSVALVVLLVLAPSSARALELEGEWPEEERVSLHLDEAPVVDALRAASSALHLGVVVAVNATERVTVHLDDVPSRAAFEAIAGDAPWKVVRSNGVVAIRPAVSVAAVPTPRAEAETAAEHASSDERVAFGNDVVIRAGERVRDTAAFGGDVDVAGEVDGDVVAFGGNVRLRCGAIVHGDVEAVGGRVVRDDCGDAANAPAPRVRGASNDEKHDEEEGLFDDLASDLQSLVFIFFVGVVFMRIRPTRYRGAMDTLRAAPLRTAGLGVLVSLASVASVLVLAITIIGIPLAVVIAFVAVVVGYLGAAVVAGMLGSLVPLERLRSSPVLELLAGACIWFVLLRLPGVGVLASVAAWLAAVGALMLGFQKRDAV